MKSGPSRCVFRVASATYLIWLGLGGFPVLAQDAVAPAAPAAESPDLVLGAMEAELKRSLHELSDRGPEPLYFLSYSVVEIEDIRITAQEGNLTDRPKPSRPQRVLRVELRVGSPQMDNTHRMSGWYGRRGHSTVSFPVEDDPDAIRVALWLATDQAFQSAQDQFLRVRTQRSVQVEEEDKSNDFSEEEPAVSLGPAATLSLDTNVWEPKIREFSAMLRGKDHILSSWVGLDGAVTTRWFVSSEGSRIRTSRKNYRVYVTGEAMAEDGMRFSLYESLEAVDERSLPADDAVEAAILRLSENLARLQEAPLIEPYAGPAILLHRAAAVFFHEIFGHRIEGHRQKNVDEGQTFTKKVGQPIMPDFISVVDDPTMSRIGDIPLLGHYEYDEEGVPAEKVSVVENGVLRNFLMGRSPVKGFPRSNGHGRAQAGLVPVARQSNLIVSSDRRVPFAKLREMLLEEAKKQGKEYALIFHDIAGGFTTTQRGQPQAFKVLPLIVTRVHVDGRPDELVRGVDIVGTPIASIENILATGDDDAAFHGYCGAESGSVPVTALSPSILVKTIEVEKQRKEQDRPPILSRPKETAPDEADDLVLEAMTAEMRRSLEDLRLEDFDGPYYIALTATQWDSYGVSATFGALAGEGRSGSPSLSVDVRVGDYVLEGTSTSGEGLPLNLDYQGIRTAAWRSLDPTYKDALNALARKKAALESMKEEDRPDDFSREDPVVLLQDIPVLRVDEELWRDVTRRISGVFRDYPDIHQSDVSLQAVAETKRTVSSEGFRQRTGDAWAIFTVRAQTQCEDGMPLADEVMYGAWDFSGLPSEAEIEQDVRAMADGLSARRSLAKAEDYTGPVLFEGIAAAEYLLAVLGSGLGSSRRGRDSLNQKIGKRILPRFFQVVDDPNRKEYAGVPLLGHFVVDDDGIRPERVELVLNGKLQTLLTSRIPTRETKESNGHSFRGRPTVGNLFIQATQTLSAEDLRAELLTAAEDEDLEYAIVIRGQAGHPSRMKGGNAMMPSEMVKVYVADGREEPVRGGMIQPATLRDLRDILAAGDDPAVYNGFYWGRSASVVAPSILFRELSVEKPPETFSKPPLLGNPFFEEKEPADIDGED